MGLKQYFSEMKKVRAKVSASPLMSDSRPTLGAGLSGFLGRIKFAVNLVFTEKELITFALLQWACIAAGYYLWVQMIGWIPEEVWKLAGKSDKASLPDLILFLWSFVCVGLVAFPLEASGDVYD